MTKAAFTVTGAGELEATYPELGPAVSRAIDHARIHRRDAGEVSFYVRENGDEARAVVTKRADGIVEVHT